jgi:hypothetical protein
MRVKSKLLAGFEHEIDSFLRFGCFFAHIVEANPEWASYAVYDAVISARDNAVYIRWSRFFWLRSE